MAVRAQAALEYILVVVLVMAVLVPFTYYGFISSQESTRVLQANRAVEAIADASKYVYSQGVGSRVTVEVFVPDGINFSGSYIGKPSWSGVDIPSREINLRLQTQKGETDVLKSLDFSVKGAWLSHSGQYLFTVYMADDGYVWVIPYEMEFNAVPVYFYYSLPLGSVQSFNFTLFSYSEVPVTVNFTPSGTVGSWISLSSNSTVIAAGGTSLITGTVAVPSGASLGVNYGVILAQSANTSIEVQFEINAYSEGGNLSLPNYTVEIFNDSAYSKPWAVFYQSDPVDVVLEGWPLGSVVTLDVRNASNSSAPGFPKNVNVDSGGDLVYYWYSQEVLPGNYTVYANNSQQTQSTVVEVKACA